jgi:hypothetical protein
VHENRSAGEFGRSAARRIGWYRKEASRATLWVKPDYTQKRMIDFVGEGEGELTGKSILLPPMYFPDCNYIW